MTCSVAARHAVTAVKGDTMISVFVIGDDEEAIARAIAQAALARSP